MGKKAKKAATDEDAAATVEETKEAAPADETKPAAKKGKAKKADAEEKPLEAKEEAAPAGDGKEIFEEKSEVAKQFEAAGETKEEITEERTYIVPLSIAHARPPKYRAKKAILLLRAFFKRHMKATEILILPEVNEEIWSKSIANPPRKIKIRATKSIEGKVTLYLAQ